MTRRYDSEALRHEIARLRAVEAASESVLDDDVRQIAMDAAKVDVQYALGQLERAIRRLGPVCELLRCRDGLERAIEAMTRTEDVQREPAS